MHYVYNPVDFDPKKTLEYLKQSADLRPGTNWEDYVRLFVHVLLHVICKYNAEDDEYVPLQGRALFRQVHSDYAATRKIQAALINAGVIECDGRYFPSEKCYGFRFCERYRNRQAEQWLITEKAIIRRKHNQPELKEFTHSCMWNWLQKTEVDYEQARQFLEDNSDSNTNVLQKSVSLEKIRAKDWFFHVDEQGRVYHNVVCLWSNFRQFLSIGGEKLINIDIKNSQPLFFAIKLREQYNPYLSHPFYYNAQEISKRVLEPDVVRYIELVEQGKLYDYLMGEFGYTNRRAFKKRFFALFYSKPNTERKLNKQFQNLFPNVFEVVCRLKKGNHCDLPLDMQRIEANLMIGQVGGRLAEEGVPFLTIHDSILTIPKYVDFVKAVIRQAFDGLGLTPTITSNE